VDCESRKFLISQQADGNGTSAWSVSIYHIIIYSSFWRGLSALSILCERAMREPTVLGWAEEQTPTPFLYHKFNF